MTKQEGERDSQGFLKRWSRLKQEEAGQQPEAATPEAASSDLAPDLAPDVVADVVAEEVQTGALTNPEDPTGIEAEAPFDPADLPDIDSLTKDSDFTGFLKEGVPEKLRHMALQKLWRSDPVLAVLDGLNDYDEDFNLVGKVAEKIISNYKPGRGYVDDDDNIEDDETETAEVEDGDIEDAEIEGAEAQDTELADAEEMATGEDKKKDA